jgi:hypothetical protein
MNYVRKHGPWAAVGIVTGFLLMWSTVHFFGRLSPGDPEFRFAPIAWLVGLAVLAAGVHRALWSPPRQDLFSSRFLRAGATAVASLAFALAGTYALGFLFPARSGEACVVSHCRAGLQCVVVGDARFRFLAKECLRTCREHTDCPSDSYCAFFVEDAPTHCVEGDRAAEEASMARAGLFRDDAGHWQIRHGR